MSSDRAALSAILAEREVSRWWIQDDHASTLRRLFGADDEVLMELLRGELVEAAEAPVGPGADDPGDRDVLR